VTTKRIDLTPIKNFFAEHPGLKRNNLIMILQKVQELYGYLPEEVIDFISEEIKVPKAKIYGVATFYSQFRLEPQGKYVINICNGTACHVKGAPSLVDEVEGILGIKSGQTTPDGLFTLETVNCIGACGLAPAVVINDKIYGKVTPEKIAELVNQLKAGEK